MRKENCEERIDEMLKLRLYDFELALRMDGKGAEDLTKEEKDWLKGEGYEVDEDFEFDFLDWINNYALAYEEDPHYRAKRLELSWGGPSDFFLFFNDGTIEYYYQDWFDGAKRELTGRDYEIMERVKNYLEC